jgi:hypothetical protein
VNEDLSTSEAKDVIGSLHHCILCVHDAQETKSAWKWVLISLHNAVQGAMVCYLNDTSQTGALTDECTEATLKLFMLDAEGKIPKQKCGTDEFGLPKLRPKYKDDYLPKPILASPNILLKRIMKGRHGFTSANKDLGITTDEQKAFKWLNHWRNEFIHFSPKGLSFGLNGVAEKCLLNLGIIKKIANDFWPFRHLRCEEKSHLSQLIEGLEEALKKPSERTQRV